MRNKIPVHHTPDKPYDFGEDAAYLYNIKYRPIGARKWRYAQFQRYQTKKENLIERFNCIAIEDALTGKLWRLDLAHFEVVEIQSTWDRKNPDEYAKYMDDELKKACEKSDKVEGCAKGKLFTTSVADGCAYYVVTGVKGNTVKIEWRGFCPDRWIDQVLGYGGTFPRHCVEHLCRDMKWSEMAWR